MAAKNHPRYIHSQTPLMYECEGPSRASIGGMRLRLQKLQEEDAHAQKIRAEKLGQEKLGQEGWEDSDEILHHQDNLGIEKTRELVAAKYYWEILRRDPES